MKRIMEELTKLVWKEPKNENQCDNPHCPAVSIPCPLKQMNTEGKITISVETWSNMGRGNWRSRQKRLTFVEYDSMTEPGNEIEHLIMTLRDKIKFSDAGSVAPKT